MVFHYCDIETRENPTSECLERVCNALYVMH